MNGQDTGQVLSGAAGRVYEFRHYEQGFHFRKQYFGKVSRMAGEEGKAETVGSRTGPRNTPSLKAISESVQASPEK